MIKKLTFKNWSDITFTVIKNSKKEINSILFLNGINEWNIDKKKKQSPTSFFQDPIKSILDAHVRMYLLSSLVVKPGEINMDGLFDILPELFWTSNGLSYTEEDFYKKFSFGKDVPLHVVDKIPPLLWMMKCPTNIRIQNPFSVRYGAHLAPGTVIKSPGEVNTNAGTLGACMIEGRIPYGSTVDAGSQLGAGSGIIGILTSNNKKPYTIGKNCLLGAQAECGISLGNNCTIEAGLSLLADMKIKEFADPKFRKGEYDVRKARFYTNKPDFKFFRHSLEGHVEVMKSEPKVVVNEVLHNKKT